MTLFLFGLSFREPRRRRHGTMTGTTDAINTPPSTERVEMRRTRSETAKLLVRYNSTPVLTLMNCCNKRN